MDQINYYQNVGTKLTMIPKCKDQNSVFTKFHLCKTLLAENFKLFVVRKLGYFFYHDCFKLYFLIVSLQYFIFWSLNF